ncbi:hypothetical protein EON64_11480 [archaeon]|nr:MAG: hypothetical protein EON64_11480 [archaeon]
MLTITDLLIFIYSRLFRRSIVVPSRDSAVPSMEKVTWRCVYALQYREVDVGALALSADLSLLTASYGSYVTLWDTKR